MFLYWIRAEIYLNCLLSWTVPTFPESLRFPFIFSFPIPFSIWIDGQTSSPNLTNVTSKVKVPTKSDSVLSSDFILKDCTDTPYKRKSATKKSLTSSLFYKQDNYVSMFNSQEGSGAINRPAGCPLSIVHLITLHKTHNFISSSFSSGAKCALEDEDAVGRGFWASIWTNHKFA